jgi:hypothetical protein
MKIKKGFVVRSIAGESVVVALGAASKNFNGIIKLNETGRFLWDILADGATLDELIEKMTAEYEVEPEIAKADIEKFVGSVRGAGIID